jgi:osmotically inducible lipoprotein OsmB
MMESSMNHIRKTTAIAASVILATLLTACGQSTSDRTLSGAGLGAGAGAVGSAVLGGNPVAGAVIGGVAGGAVGGLTNSNQIDLGKPAWR